MSAVEKVISKAVNAEKETSEKTERHIHTKDKPSVQTERPPQPKESIWIIRRLAQSMKKLWRKSGGCHECQRQTQAENAGSKDKRNRQGASEEAER